MKIKTLIALCAFLFCLTAGLGHATSQDQGPAIGERVDLNSFRSRSGRTLTEALKQHSVAMVVLVDPNCETCTTSKESLRALRDRVAASKIAYCVLMIPAGSDTEKYFTFADSLKLDAEAFVWSNTEVKPPASLSSMTRPSHLQLTSEGIIVEKWSGIPAKDAAPQ